MTKTLPSIIDVAERAGVSVATASRVMSSSTYPVSNTTRQKVLKAATELNYAPNSLARSLKAQRSKLIAVLVGDNTDPYFAQVTRGVEEVAKENGYLTIICNTERSPERELSYLQMLQDYRTDGIIFTGSGLYDPGYVAQLETLTQKITARGAAVITLSPHVIQTPALHTDNFGGAYAMTKRLIELGHTRIAFITGPANALVSTMRMQGFIAALASSGIELNPNFILPGDFTQTGGAQVAQLLNELPVEQRPSATFAVNDETAFGLLMGLQRLHWHIPQDISICGFGDLPDAQIIVPTLTTVRIGLRELGRAGAQKLFALLQHQETPILEILSTTIIERETTIALPCSQQE